MRKIKSFQAAQLLIAASVHARAETAGRSSKAAEKLYALVKEDTQ